MRGHRARSRDPVPRRFRALTRAAPPIGDNASMTAPLALALAASALLAIASAAPSGDGPPARFARDAAGRAADGQTVRDTDHRRVQRIAVLPDRTTGRDWGLPYLEAAVEDLNIVRPDAVFTVGDMVQGYTRDVSRWDREVDAYLGRVSRLVPTFYPTPGNHDVISGSRAAADRTFADRYRERFGPLWYAVELDLATAIILFSDEGLGDGKIVLGDGQLAWLTGALDAAAARGKPIFLLMHRPMWRSTSVKWESRVQPLLEKAGVDAVIAGHFHALQRDPDVNGVQYHIVGTCGGMIDQPPLAGQLQHLTFVDCGDDGSLRVWHQPVGMVLPEDFVTRADQDRVWKLRESGAAKATASLPDPATLAAPARAAFSLVAKNPLDVPITLTLSPPGLVSLPGQAPAWWTAGRAGRGTPGAPAGANGWTSHALADVDNEHTMSAHARAVVRVDPAALSVELAPGESRTVEVPVEVLPQPVADVRAPQVDLYATFVDGKGRTVPVYLPTRLPIARTVRAGTYPVLAWDYSPYDTREANPSVTVAPARGAGATGVTLTVDVPDDAFVGAPQWTVPDDRRRSNPHADALRVLVDREGESSVDVLIEPRTPGLALPAEVTALEVRPGDSLADGRAGWSVTLTIPAARRVTALQVGVADNDDTFHTQWRWMAPGGPKGRWGVELAPPAGGTAP
jgi:hypothetical protein